MGAVKKGLRDFPIGIREHKRDGESSVKRLRTDLTMRSAENCGCREGKLQGLQGNCARGGGDSKQKAGNVNSNPMFNWDKMLSCNTLILCVKYSYIKVIFRATI